MPILLTGLGTVTALNTATVGSQVTGLLISVDFHEGQLVKKDELLAQIDPRTYQAQVDQAEATLSHDQANLKNAQLNLERYRGLANENSIAREQFDNQQATVEELNAQIKSGPGGHRICQGSAELYLVGCPVRRCHPIPLARRWEHHPPRDFFDNDNGRLDSRRRVQLHTPPPRQLNLVRRTP